jgi:general secretion pathway protein N
MSWPVPARFRLPAALAALCAVLAGFIWYQLGLPTAYAPASAPTAPTATDAKPADALVGVPSAPAKERYAEIVERPVFMPTRRPASAQAAAVPAAQTAKPAPAAPSPLQSYALIGVLLDGDQRIAVLKQASSPATVRVIEGDTVQGWTAAQIAADRVVFRSGSGEYVVEFPKPITNSSNPPTSAPRPASVSNANPR